MGWKKIRSLIKDRLDSVPGMGRVHDYVRHTKFWSDFFKRHVADGRVNNWEITRTGAPVTQAGTGGRTAVGCIYHVDHQVQIVGRLALTEKTDPASEVVFQDLCDDVSAALRAEPTLNGALILPILPSLPTIGHQTYGGVLVHQATFTFSATERVKGGEV